jgi:predicted ATPase
VTAPAPLTVPVVGRAAERQALRAALAAAQGGTGAVVLVTGPAGIGKTRLLELLVADAATAQVPVAWGRCPAEQGVPPLWPWRRVLDAAGAPAPAGADPPSAAAATPEDTAAVRLVVASAVCDALVGVACSRGLVVVLEDVHWADGASLDLLRHLAAEVRRSRLLVLVSARDGDGAELPPAVAELVLLPGVELVPLGPLPVAGVAAYLSAAAGRPVDPAAVQLVHQRSGGNPLYVRTVARVLGPALLEPVVVPEELAARLAGSSEVRHLVGAGLRPLDDGVRDLLRVASLLGEEVDPALLASVTQRPLADVEAGLDAAGAAGLLGPVPGSAARRRFVHALVRDGVQSELADAARARWHVRAATVLEGAAAVRPDLSGEVAFHWLRGRRDP